MKVNKKQKPAGNSRGMASKKPPARKTPLGASRNQNVQRSVAAAYSTGNSGRAPKVSMNKDSCRVVHRELLGNVSGTASTAYTVASTFELNPGLVLTFPWLSNMAQNWESYRFNSLRVCYYTRTGSNTAGSVIIVPDYDASDASPISEQTASSYEDVQEDAPWKDMCCTLRPQAMHSVSAKKFIRSGALSTNANAAQDIKLYDVGKLFICTVDSAGAASWGKLWIEYDVTLFTPQLFPSGSNFATILAVSGSGGLTSANIFGTAAVVTGNLPGSAVTNTLTLNQLVVGAEYICTMALSGTAITVAPGISSSPGLTQKTAVIASFPVAATSANLFVTFTATATSGSIVFTITATTITATDLIFSLAPTSTF